MSRRKTGIIAVVACMALGFGVRFHFVNRDVDLPVVRTFGIGETVPFGDDFINSSEEQMNGYTMQVVSSELLEPELFFEKYNRSDKYTMTDITEGYAEYFYVVRVIAGNIDNPYAGEKGINLNGLSLVGTNYMMLVDDMGFELANPEMPGLDFSLRQNSELELVLPYAVLTEVHTNYNHIIENPPKLLITEYPHQKMLEIT